MKATRRRIGAIAALLALAAVPAAADHGDVARAAHRLQIRMEQAAETAKREVAAHRLPGRDRDGGLELVLALVALERASRTYADLTVDFRDPSLRAGAKYLIAQAEDIEWLVGHGEVTGPLEDDWQRARDAVGRLAEAHGLPFRQYRRMRPSQDPARRPAPTPTPAPRVAHHDHERHEVEERDIAADGSGSFRWRGVVGGTDRIHLRGDQVDIQHLSMDLGRDIHYELTGRLPARAAEVKLRKRRGRGTVRILEQPSQRNRYKVIVEIDDHRRGNDLYEFELRW